MPNILLQLGNQGAVWTPVSCCIQVTFRSVEDIEEELRARRQYAKDHGAQAYESSDDEDGGRGNQRVQCAQQ